MLNKKLQSTAVGSVSLDLGMAILKGVLGKDGNDSETLKGHEKKFAIHLRSALDKKVAVQ